MSHRCRIKSILEMRKKLDIWTVNIGNQLREIRKKLGWTQSELASKCGVTLRTIQRIESGEVTPSPYTLGRLKKELGTDFSELREERITSSLFFNFKHNQTMQAFLSLLFGKTFQKTALALFGIASIGFGLSKSNFWKIDPTPSSIATVETVNCGSETECDILLTVKHPEGELLLQKNFGGSSYDKASEVIQTPDGGYLILGSTSSFGNGNYDILLIKTDDQGMILWEKSYGGFFNEYGKQLALTPSKDSITIEGTQQVCTTPNVSDSCIQERWTFEVDLDGNLKS